MIDLIDALNCVNQNIQNHGQTQTVGLFEAVDRILAEDILCKRPLPPFSNSAMDGYGVKLSDAGKSLNCDGTIFAGDKPNIYVKNGTVIKIMTGAPTNDSIEAVVPFEDAKVIDDKVLLPNEIKPMANIRPIGEEIAIGAMLAKRGQKLTPALVGLLASQGIMTVKVASKPKIGLISSGSEIIEPWEEAGDFQIYNSNAPLLYAYCTKFGCEVEYIKLVADSYEDTKEFLSKLNGHDLLITTGGISAGEADYILQALKSNGFETLFEKVNIKPGKPTVFGLLGKTAVLALPGNPLAAAVNFYLFGSIIIAKLMGQINFWPQIVRVKNANEFKIKNARSNQLLGTVENGEFTVYNGGKYGSGMLSPLANSSAFIILNAGAGTVPKGIDLNVVLMDTSSSQELGDLISYA